MGISIAVIVGYLTVTTLIGSALARRTKTSTQWAVAGGGMGMLFLAFGIAGTRIGGAGTYGVAGNVMNGGVWYGWWYGINTFLALAIVGIFFAVPYRRLKLHTVGEIFNLRFGSRRSQVFTSFCVQTEYFIINVIEAYIIGVMLVGLTGMDMTWGVTIAAIVLVTYTALGGLIGASVTNLIHCGVILIGLATVGIMGIGQIGGWQTVTERIGEHLAQAERSPEAWWGFAGAGWGAVIGMFFSAAIHTPAASIYTNFASAARSERIIIPGFLLAGAVGAMMPLLAGLVGLLTLAEYGYVPIGANYENITRLATDINPYIGGIALAAVLAAVISSGGPILLSSATMFVRDWLPFTASYTGEQKLKAYRITTAIYGVIAAVFAWWNYVSLKLSVLDMLLFGFAMVVPPAVAIGYLLYWKRTTEAGVFWGMVTGYVAGFVWFVLIKWALAVQFTAPEGASAARRLFHYCFVHTGDGIDPSYATTLVPLVVVPIVSLLTASREEGKAHFYDVVSGRVTIEEHRH